MSTYDDILEEYRRRKNGESAPQATAQEQQPAQRQSNGAAYDSVLQEYQRRLRGESQPAPQGTETQPIHAPMPQPVQTAMPEQETQAPVQRKPLPSPLRDPGNRLARVQDDSLQQQAQTPQKSFASDPFGFLFDKSGQVQQQAEEARQPSDPTAEAGRGKTLPGGQRMETVDPGRLTQESGAEDYSKQTLGKIAGHGAYAAQNLEPKMPEATGPARGAGLRQLEEYDRQWNRREEARRAAAEPKDLTAIYNQANADYEALSRDIEALEAEIPRLEEELRVNGQYYGPEWAQDLERKRQQLEAERAQLEEARHAREAAFLALPEEQREQMNRNFIQRAWAAVKSGTERAVATFGRVGWQAIDGLFGRDGVVDTVLGGIPWGVVDGAVEILRDITGSNDTSMVDPLGDLAARASNTAGQYEARAAARLQYESDPVKTASDILYNAEIMLPYLLLVKASGGTSIIGGTKYAGAGTTAGLEYLSAVESAGSSWAAARMAFGETVRLMAHDAGAQWTWLTQFAESAATAREEGADGLEILTYALTNASVNTLVEMGGGLQRNLGEGLRALRPDKLARTMLEESGEEELQHFFENGLKQVYKNVELYSEENPEALINPDVMTQIFIDTALTTPFIVLEGAAVDRFDYRRRALVAARNQATANEITANLESATEQDGDEALIAALEEIGSNRRLSRVFKEMYRTSPQEAIESIRQSEHAEAGEPQGSEGERIAAPPSEARNDSAAASAQAQEAPTEAKPYTAVDALTGVDPRAQSQEAAPAQEGLFPSKPTLKNDAKTRSQKRVARLLNQVQTQEQWEAALREIVDDPALAQAYYDLTEREASEDLDSLTARRQEPAGRDLAQGGIPAPANAVNAQETAPREFNSENRVGESREPAIGSVLDTPASRNSNFESDKAAEAKADARDIVGKLRDSIPDISSMEPVSSVSGTEFAKGSTNLVEQVASFFKQIGNKVFRRGLGDVVLDRRSVKNDIAHGIGRAKAATFAAVPDVIAKGKIIDHHANWKGRGYDSYVIAAPIDYNGARSYVAAVVLRDSNNRFYLHEVVSDEGGLIRTKNDASASIKTGVAARSGTTGEAKASDTSVPDRGDNVNSKSADSGAQPESSAEYAQQQRQQRNEEMQRREDSRAAEEEDYQEENEQTPPEPSQEEEIDPAEMNKAAMELRFGEERMASLQKSGERMKELVGEGYFNGGVANEGAEGIQDFAATYTDMLEGKATPKDVCDAYLDLRRKTSGVAQNYFFDEKLEDLFDSLSKDYDRFAASEEHEKRLREEYADRFERASRILSHRFAYAKEKLQARVALQEAFQLSKGSKVGKNIIASLEDAKKRQELRPSTVFRYLAGLDPKGGEALYAIADEIDRSLSNRINTYETAEDYLSELSSMKGFKDFMNGKKTVKNVLPGVPGKEISATHALSLLKTLETSGVFEDLLHGADITLNLPGEKTVTFDPISPEIRDAYVKAKNSTAAKKAAYKAREEVKRLIKDLHTVIDADPLLKTAYDNSFGVFGYLKRAVNKSSRANWGVDFASQGKNYYPVSAIVDSSGPRLLNAPSYGLNENKRLIERKHAGHLQINSFTDVMESYIQDMSHWSAYQGLSDLLDLYSRQSDTLPSLTDLTKTKFGDKSGAKWNGWLEDYVKDLNKTREGSKYPILSRIRSNLALSSLSLNVGVALKQTASAFNFAGVIDYDIVLSRFATGLLKTKGMYKNNPLIQTVGEYTRFLDSRESENHAFGDSTEYQKDTWISKFVKWSHIQGLISRMDYRTVANGMLACADQVKRNHKGDANFKTDSDAFYKEVAALFEKAVMNTQPIYDREFRAEYLRTSNELIRGTAMFRTQPTQNYNNFVESSGELTAAKERLKAARENAKDSGSKQAQKALDEAKADVREARKKAYGTRGGLVSSTLVLAAINLGTAFLRHKLRKFRDDDDELDWEEILAQGGYDALSSLLGTEWILGRLAPFAIDVITGMDKNLPDSQLDYGLEDAGLAVVNDALTAIKSFSAGPSPSTGKALALSLASVFGIPMSNAYRILNTVTMYAGDFTGVNYDHSDDFVSVWNAWWKADAAKRGRISMRRALSMLENGTLPTQAEAILSSIGRDNDTLNAARDELKQQYILGAIDEKTYREILQKYCGVIGRSVLDDLVESSNAKRRFNEAESRALALDEGAAEAAKERLGDLNSTNDPTFQYRMDVILDLGLSVEHTDAYVEHYSSKAYYSNYSVLREAGLSPSRANDMIQNFDLTGDGKFSQDELWTQYQLSPSMERYIELLWNEHGWTGKNTKTWDAYKAHQEGK